MGPMKVAALELCSPFKRLGSLSEIATLVDRPLLPRDFIMPD